MKNKNKTVKLIQKLGEEEVAVYYDGNQYRKDILTTRYATLFFISCMYLSMIFILYSSYLLIGKSDYNYYLSNYRGDTYQVLNCTPNELPNCYSDNIKTRLVK